MDARQRKHGGSNARGEQIAGAVLPGRGAAAVTALP
jgi:hypothetical protein